MAEKEAAGDEEAKEEDRRRSEMTSPNNARKEGA
jgi:hypothetical protein